MKNKENQNPIRDLRKLTGLTQTRFGEAYGIPLRTIQNWENEVNTPPDYVVDLLKRAVKEDFPGKNKKTP